ncbi:hypothetical protein AVEN_5059-1 [Araneus ventricosus]|uniref:Uncharacterized protein n=1 Tax=Araneus ventricosus TaxID=182803 RepID=A0A4Y2P052_ARAVE|nr:hypothetical protein AVEN_5059-1 [Araneus ventricosus]
MQLLKLFDGHLLVVSFHKLIEIIAIHLQSLDLIQRHNFDDYRHHSTLSQTSRCHIRQHSPANFFQAEAFVPYIERCKNCYVQNATADVINPFEDKTDESIQTKTRLTSQSRRRQD